MNLYSYTLWQVPCNECPINVGDGTRLAYRDPRMSASGQSFQRSQWLKLGISSSWILRRSISGKWLWPSVSRQRRQGPSGVGSILTLRPCAAPTSESPPAFRPTSWTPAP